MKSNTIFLRRDKNYGFVRARRVDVEWLLTLICVSLIKFGDAIEVYLPGVITQHVSCDLHITSVQEGILATSIYLFLTIATPIGYIVSEVAGRKKTLLLGMYFSIVSTVFCSIVHNYYTLLASRCIIGFSVGLNSTICGIYFAEMSPHKGLYTLGTVVQQLSSAAGAAVVGVLGYFFLEQLGWRIFILLSSIPVFIPAIFLLHCFLPETSAESGYAGLCASSAESGYAGLCASSQYGRCGTTSLDNETQGTALAEGTETQTSAQAEGTERQGNHGNSSLDNGTLAEGARSRIRRGIKEIKFMLVLKISILMFGDGYIGQGQIIFLPNLIRNYNEEGAVGAVSAVGSAAGQVGKECYGVTGTQYLILSGVAACNVLGRIISYLCVKNVSYKKCVIVFSLIMLGTYGVMLGSDDITLLEIALGIIQVLIAIQIAYGFVILSDIELLGANAVNISATVITSAYHFGYFVGNVVPAFSPVVVSLVSCLVMAGVRFCTSLTLKLV